MTDTTTSTESVTSRYGSRKFLIVAFLLAVATAGLFTGKLDQTAFVSLVTMLCTVYLGANVAQKKLPTLTTTTEKS